jgi:CRP-like cAMP-binding protein
MSVIENLRRVDIFRGLSLEELESLARGVVVRGFPATTVLYGPTEVDDRVFVLLEGRVDLSRRTRGGKRLITRRVRRGSIFAETALLGRVPQGAFAEAFKGSLVCEVTRERMLQVIAGHPEVAERVLLATYDHLEQLEQRLEHASFSPVRVRLAHFLLANVDGNNGVVAGLTQAEIGDSIGALRQTVTETLSELQRLGLVKVGYKRVTVIKPDELEQMAFGPDTARTRNGHLPGRA